MNTEWKYVKPTTLEKIECVEKEYNIKLPADLKNCILKNNNGRPVNASFDTDKSKGRTIKKLLSYNKEDRENIYSFVDVVRKEAADLFPVATDEFGNFICLKNDKLVLWLHETGGEEFIANSMTDFISNLHD